VENRGRTEGVDGFLDRVGRLKIRGRGNNGRIFKLTGSKALDESPQLGDGGIWIECRIKFLPSSGLFGL